MREGTGSRETARWRVIWILGIGAAAAALVFGAVASGVGEGSKETAGDEPAQIVPAEDRRFTNSGTLAPGCTQALLHVDPATGGLERFIRFPAGLHVPPHWHTATETVVIVSGSAVLEIAGEKKTLGPGSYALIPSYAHHEIWIGSEGAEIYQRSSSAMDHNSVTAPAK